MSTKPTYEELEQKVKELEKEILVRKQADKELRDAKQKWMSLTQNTHDFIMIIDDKGSIQYINRALPPHTANQVIGKTLYDFAAPEHHESMRHAMAQVFETGEQGSYTSSIEHPTGIQWFDTTMVPITEGQKVTTAMSFNKNITERVQAEQALHESEDKYRNLVERANDGITIIQDTIVKYVNLRLAEMWGGTVEEIIGTPFTDFVHPDDIAKVSERYKLSMAGENITPIYETLLRRKDGSKVYAELNAGVITYEGRPANLAIVRDITERKRAEEALRESEEKYRTILESIDDGYFEVDIKGNFTFINDSTCRILGYSKDELMGMNNREYMDQENAEKSYKTFNRVYKTGKPEKGFHCEFIRKDGTKRHVETSVSLIKDVGGSPAGFRGIFRDVTERKKIETELIRTKNFLQNIFDSSIDGITTTDLHGNVIYTSPRAKDILGYRQEEIIGKKICSLYSNGKEDAKAIMKILTEEVELRDHEMKYIRKDGTLIDVNVSASLLRNEKGEIIGTLGIYRDITEKKRAEQKLQKEQEKFQILVEKSPLGISSIGRDGTYQYINPKFIEIFGYIMEDIPTGREWFKKAYPDEEYRKQAISTWVKDVKETEAGEFHPAIFSVKCKDGSEKVIHFRMVSMETGEQLVIYEDITERKRAEEALRQSEERYRSLIESTEDSIYLVDRECRYLFMNRKHLSRFSLPLHKVIGRSYAEFHSERETREFTTKVNEVFKTGKSLSYEYRSERDGGYYIRTLSPVREPDGEIFALTVDSKDITDRKQAEERITFLAEVLSSSPLSVIATDKGEKITYVNPAAERLFGYTHDELLGKNPIILNADPDAEKIQRDISNTNAQGKVWRGEILNKKKNGELFPIFASVYQLLDEEGNFIAVVGFQEDITERKQAEEVLRKSQKNLQRAQQIGHLGNWDWDVKKGTLTWSDEVYRLFGVDKDLALTYESIEEMIHPDDREKNQVKVNELLTTADTVEFELRIIRADGAVRHIYQNTEVSRDEAGNVIQIFGIMQDITERKKAEEELRESQNQLRSLADHLQSVRENERTAIAREIHDDLGQALTALNMDLSWLAKKIPKDQTQLFDKLHSMSELTSNTLRTLQRISTELRPGLLDDLGLVAAIEWQAEEFQNRTGIRCTLTVDPDITLEDRRSTALFRIFQETLTNVARHAQATIVHVSLTEKDGDLNLRIRDNGIGITKEQISDPKSFGIMGMKERIHIWRGEVKISGRPGKGTTVVLRVPVE